MLALAAVGDLIGDSEGGMLLFKGLLVLNLFGKPDDQQRYESRGSARGVRFFLLSRGLFATR